MNSFTKHTYGYLTALELSIFYEERNAVSQLSIAYKNNYFIYTCCYRDKLSSNPRLTQTQVNSRQINSDPS